jgi:hypothetical protein
MSTLAEIKSFAKCAASLHWQRIQLGAKAFDQVDVHEDGICYAYIGDHCLVAGFEPAAPLNAADLQCISDTLMKRSRPWPSLA